MKRLNEMNLDELISLLAVTQVDHLTGENQELYTVIRGELKKFVKEEYKEELNYVNRFAKEGE